MSKDNYPLLFEMIRSFITLARTLNLSHAVEELNSTRQTVRRHIANLEQAKGVRLFRVNDRRYELTEEGHRALPEAETLIERSHLWLMGESDHLDGLFHLASPTESDGIFIQQHPISEIWQGSSQLMKRALAVWAESEGRIDHPAFDDIRPYHVVFRYNEGSWVCVDVGSQSSYATWYGREWELSSVGRSLPSLPGGHRLANVLTQPYDDIRATRGVRFDHTQTRMIRATSPDPEPISYMRLLMGCRFPDQSFALVSIIERTHDIQIQGLPEEQRLAMDKSWVTDIKLN